MTTMPIPQRTRGVRPSGKPLVQAGPGELSASTIDGTGGPTPDRIVTERTSQTARRNTSNIRAVGLFLVVAFSLSWAWAWAWAWPLALSSAVVTRGDGWPTHFPALFGPAVAAFLITAWVSGRTGVNDLLRRMGRWRFPLRWWAVTLSPLAFLAPALLVQAVVGDLPAAGDFGRYTGLPAMGVFGVAVLAIVLNGFGEETG